MSSAPVVVTFHRLANREFAEAMARYTLHSARRATRYREAVREAIERIEAFPLSAPVVYVRFRQMLVRRFPYSLVYLMLSPPEARVIAVAHARRRPGYWRRRVP